MVRRLALIALFAVAFTGCQLKEEQEEYTPRHSLTPIPPPADVAAPPADAERTPSGLAFKILTPGTGSIRPTRASFVTVHYTGWTAKGVMFDSSVAKGPALTMDVNRFIEGWKEGLTLMTIGEKRRFWIPENLAYQGQRGQPPGMLVFDVELLDIR